MQEPSRRRCGDERQSDASARLEQAQCLGARRTDPARWTRACVPNIAARAQALAEPGAVVVTARVQRHRLRQTPLSSWLFRLVRASGGGRTSPKISPHRPPPAPNRSQCGRQDRVFWCRRSCGRPHPSRIKKIGRIGSVGHRITGRYPGAINRHHGIGWEFVHVCIDDASRGRVRAGASRSAQRECCRFNSASARWIASAARTARSASFSCATG